MASSNPTVRRSVWALRLGAVAAFSGAISAPACSEQYADAVVADPRVSDHPGSTTGAPFSDEPGTAIDLDDRGLPDLCKRCTSDDECGGSNDSCLDLPGLVGYCGMDCEGPANCPRGYSCVLKQCAPSSGSCDDLGGDLPDGDTAREYVLQLINDIRLDHDLGLLRQDNCLDGVAEDALVEWENTGVPGTMFRDECLDSPDNCRCDWEGEGQDWVSLERRSWQEALAHPFSNVEDENDEFHHVLTEEWDRVGIAVDFEDTYVLISVEFGP